MLGSGGGALLLIFFFFNDTATTEIYTLSLHDALPIYLSKDAHPQVSRAAVLSLDGLEAVDVSA